MNRDNVQKWADALRFDGTLGDGVPVVLLGPVN